MYPILDLGFIQIPVYGLCAIIGFIVAFSLYMHNARGRHINGWDVLYSSLYVIAGIFFGAKILYFITKVPTFVKAFSYFIEQSPDDLFEYLFGGYVFYGGLIGGAIAFAYYCVKFKLPIAPMVESAAPAIPLFHAFGRMGCFFAGCCYGMEYDGPFAVTYPLNIMTTDIAGVPRFPTPVVEAVFNLLLCAVLLVFVSRHGEPVYYKWKLKYDGKTKPMILNDEGFIVVVENTAEEKTEEEKTPEQKAAEEKLTEEKIKECPVEYVDGSGSEMIISFMNRPVRKPLLYKKAFSPIGIYLICYGVFRFIIEFTRSDSARGGIGALSTSQLVSLVLVPAGIWLLVRKEKKNARKK